MKKMYNKKIRFSMLKEQNGYSDKQNKWVIVVVSMGKLIHFFLVLGWQTMKKKPIFKKHP